MMPANKTKKTTGKYGLRASFGSVIVLAVAFVAVFVAVFLVLSVFLFDAGASELYRDKVHSVTRQALAAYVGETAWMGAKVPNVTLAQAQIAVTADVNKALTQMGLPNAQVTCSVSNQIATVNVSVQGLSLFHGPTIFPSTVNIQDSMSADLSIPHKGLYGLSVPGSSAVYLPTYGKFLPPWSNGGTSLNSAPKCVATFYNAVQPYNQYNLTVTGDSYSDTCP